MRTTLKMVLPLIVSVAIGCLIFAAYQVNTERRMLRNDLLHSAEITGESLQEAVEPLLDQNSTGSIQRLVERFSQREHLKGAAVYGANGTPLAITRGLPSEFESQPQAATRAAAHDGGYGQSLIVSIVNPCTSMHYRFTLMDR